MCGIVGYISKDDDVYERSKNQYFHEALFADTLRGFDSTGVMSLLGDFQWSWSKQAIPGTEFVQQKSFRERNRKTWCSVGHNRAATSGSVTTDNAHPFVQGDIFMVHNGTLRSTYNFDHRGVFDVDSELLCYNLSQEAPEDAHKVLTNIQGAYALVWFDARDETVNFARNHERPFHVGLNKAEDLLLFASDGYLLNFCANRMADPQTRPTNIWQMGTGQQLKYRKGEMVPETIEVRPFTRQVWYPSREDTTRTGTTTPTRRMGGSGSLGTSNIVRVPGRMCTIGRAKVNNKIQPIPACFTEMVEYWYGLKHDVPIFFEANKYMPWGSGETGMIWGSIYHPDWDCWYDAYVEGSPSMMTLYSDKPWTVHVAGVSHVTREKPGGVTFMCKIATYNWDGNNDPYENIARECEDAVADIQQNIDELEDFADVALVTGPHGDITPDAFQILAADGCVMCGGPIFINDHDDITWVGEMGNQPLCYSCLEHHTQAEEDAKNRALQDSK